MPSAQGQSTLPLLREMAQSLYRLFNSPNAPDDRDRDGWTIFVGQCLRQCVPDGSGFGGKGMTDSEYLVDFSAWKRGEPHPEKDYAGLILAVESEWNPEGAWEDIVKLADVRADRKIFIGRQRTAQAAEALVVEFDRFWKKHRHVDTTEEVLLMIDDAEAGDFRSWIVSRLGGPTVVG